MHATCHGARATALHATSFPQRDTGWYVRSLPGGEAFRSQMNGLEESHAQVAAVERFFDDLNQHMDRIPGQTARDTETTTRDSVELAV